MCKISKFFFSLCALPKTPKEWLLPPLSRVLKPWADGRSWGSGCRRWASTPAVASSTGSLATWPLPLVPSVTASSSLISSSKSVMLAYAFPPFLFVHCHPCFKLFRFVCWSIGGTWIMSFGDLIEGLVFVL